MNAGWGRPGRVKRQGEAGHGTALTSREALSCTVATPASLSTAAPVTTVVLDSWPARSTRSTAYSSKPGSRGRHQGWASAQRRSCQPAAADAAQLNTKLQMLRAAQRRCRPPGRK